MPTRDPRVLRTNSQDDRRALPGGGNTRPPRSLARVGPAQRRGDCDCLSTLSGATDVRRGPLDWTGEGTVVPVLPATVFNFSYLGVSAVETRYIAAAIDVVPYYTGTLVVRLHNNSMASGRGATMAIQVYGSAPSARDPRDFLQSEADMSLTISDVSVHASPAFFNDSTTLVTAGFYAVRLVATQGGSAGFSVAAELSVDLVMHE